MDLLWWKQTWKLHCAGVQMGAVTSYLSAHPGVQCAASDLIHICAYGSVGQYTAVVSC